MDSSSQPHRRIAGLKPEALMAQGMAAESLEAIDVPGCEIEAPLGRGGMGAVYLARQVSLDREVAVKVLANELADDPLFLERLEREARLMARLRHPNIVTVHDFQKLEDGGAAIVMEFVEGGSLRERLRRHPQGLPLAEALRIIREIAAGLETAHASGVIHRDMKPENVLLDRDGTARVTDFGLALPLHESTRRLTLTGTTVGTVDYMAPEQFKGGDLDARLDVYALGVIAYELLTGQTLRGSFDPPHHLRADLSLPISAAVMKALKPVPAERFVTIEAFVLALHESAVRRRTRWPWLIGMMLAMAAAVFWLWSQPQPGPWRDAIAGIRIYEDVISGEWKNRDGILTSGPQICVVKLEAEMPESYDVRAVFTRLSGEHSVALFFRSAGKSGAVDLDAWKEGLAGVQELNGRDLRSGYGFRFSLVNGERHELLVEVRPEEVRVSVDGELKQAFDTARQTLSITTAWGWNSQARPMALGLGSYLSPTRFEKVEWRARVAGR